MVNWFAKLGEVQWYTWLMVAALIAIFALLVRREGRQARWNSRMIAYGAMSIAISFVLSYVRIWKMPQGGSVTLASALPVVAFSLGAGPISGLLVGIAYGMLQLVQDMGYIVHPVQLLMDYPLAFGALTLGSCAVFMPIPRIMKLPVAILIGSLGRLVFHTASGVLFFAEYAAESGQTPMIYSLIYNGTFLAADAAVCIALSFIPGVSRITDIIEHAQLKSA